MMRFLSLFHLDYQHTVSHKNYHGDDDDDDDDENDDGDNDNMMSICKTVTLQPVIVGDNIWMVECCQNTNLEYDNQ